MTYYLRFPDQETAEDAFVEAGFSNSTLMGEERVFNYYSHDHAIDIVGVIYNDDGTFDPETLEVITPPTPIEGWHVNYLGELPDGWEEYLVTPETPRRKFAGVG